MEYFLFITKLTASNLFGTKTTIYGFTYSILNPSPKRTLIKHSRRRILEICL